MLRHIDPILGPDLLAILRAMGHGDEIVIVDANFPATSTAQELVRADGVSATDIAAAILKLMPLDDFVEQSAFCMKQVHAPDELAPIAGEFAKLITQHAGSDFTLTPLERFAFYERAKTAFAIVATGERRLYGTLILKKGVLRPGEG
jgi:L-fucose mutarotase